MNSKTSSTTYPRPTAGRLTGWLGLLILGCWAGLTPAARADNLDKALLREAVQVMDHLKKEKYKNVGVLKFRVAKGKAPLSFDVGPLNSNMADRLENALILSDDSETPIGIIKNASQVAVQKKLASYMTPKGLNSLFEETYPLAWSDARVKADAFVTGIVKISPDMTKAVVTLEVLDRASLKQKSIHFTKVAEFDVKTDRTILGDIGQSFLVKRSARGFSPDEQDTVAAKDSADRDDNKTPPTQSQENYIELGISYNGQKQNPTPDPGSGGELHVPEPQEGQKVSLSIKNISNVQIGVVLMVNGLSTWQAQTDEPINCLKWILDPGVKFDIQGIYQDVKSYQPFRVLSAAESEAKSFTEYTGMIHAHVFITGTSEKKNFTGDKTSTGTAMNISRNLSLRTRSLRPGDKTAKPRTLKDLQAKLSKSVGTRKAKRGLIDVDPDAKPDVVEQGSFPNPALVETVAVRYYKQKN